jgi:hypothetical protein
MMRRNDFQTKYPNLFECIEHISFDNSMPMQEDFDVPLWMTASLEIFETQAGQLSHDEKEILAMGEDREREEVVKATGFEYFDDFLSDVFEGMLSDIFWTSPGSY